MYLQPLCLCYAYWMIMSWLTAMVVLIMCYVGLSAGWQNVIQKCLFLWDNVVGHKTFGAMANMLAWPIIGAICVRVSIFLTICLDLILMTSLSCKLTPLSFRTFIAHCLKLLLATILLCSFLSIAFPFWVLFVCWLHCTLLLILLLLCVLVHSTGLLLILFNMSANGSILVWDCFVALYCMFESTVTDMGFMCCLLHVIHLPLAVNCMV